MGNIGTTSICIIPACAANQLPAVSWTGPPLGDEQSPGSSDRPLAPCQPAAASPVGYVSVLQLRCWITFACERRARCVFGGAPPPLSAAGGCTGSPFRQL